MNKNYLEILSDANNLFDAYLKARQGSDWKESVQRTEANLLVTLSELQKTLRDDTYQQKPYYEFVMKERGKTRPIRSLSFRDRIVQRSLCDNVLIPVLRPCLIYDNGASLKGKGVMFSRKRLRAHLEKYLRHYQDGYVLLIDFSKFFDNIPHEELLQMIQSRIRDDVSIQPLLKHILKSFCPDVSYMSEDEYREMSQKPFDSLKHRDRLKEYTGEMKGILLERSMGIGSQISQIAGVFYPTPIDNFFKVRLGLKFYGRYMDDVYIIHHDKEILKHILNEFCEQAKRMKMFVNRKKTQIEKLSHGFTYLQTRYRVVAGRVSQRLCNKTFIRERRRLKRFRNLLDHDRLTRKQISNAYQTWRGTVIRYANRKQNLKYTDSLYLRLFYYN